MAHYFLKGQSVIWEFRYRFTVVERLASPIVHRKCEMVCGNGTPDCLPKAFYDIHRRTARRMLQDDAQLWKLAVQFDKMWQKVFFGIQHASVLII